MLIQTQALLVDAYRELNARKLFWITMLLSGLFVAAFAMVGLNKEGMTVLWMTIPIDVFNTDIISKDLFYKQLFLVFGIGIWLSWIATGLALVSTSSIFPSLLTGGQIETMLSKPISRTRLFLTKFATGLLFVFLQVAVFCVASFLVIGLRGGSWLPGIFLAIPIVLLFFSYLFAFMTLIGVLTRSAIASLLVTALFWFFLFILNTTDVALMQVHQKSQMDYERGQQRIVRAEENAAALYRTRQRVEGNELPEGYEPTQEELDSMVVLLPTMREGVERDQRRIDGLRPWRRGIYIAKTILPNTSETIGLLQRYVMSQEDMDRWMRIGAESESADNEAEPPEEQEVSSSELGKATQDELRNRPLSWILGSSIGFVLVVLFIAGWIFNRKDF